MKIHAVILTGGKGERLSSNLPKQFIEIKGKPLFVYTLEKFTSMSIIDDVILVVNSGYNALYHEILNTYHLENITLVEGGATRQESVFNALQYLKNIDIDNDDIVIIHDGARPLVSQELIYQTIVSCGGNQCAAISAIYVNDTIVDLDYNVINREKLRSIQTPQTFIFSQIYSFHEKLKEKGVNNLTDDGQIAKMFKAEIVFVEGERTNIKVTTKDDLLLLEKFL